MKRKSGWMKGKWWLFIVLLPALGCVFICLYFTVIRYVDQSICYNDIAKRTGVKPEWGSIARYIEGNVTKGMTEKEAIQVLERVGPVKKEEPLSGINLENGGKGFQYSVGGCIHYLNVFSVLISFYDGKVENILVDDYE